MWHGVGGKCHRQRCGVRGQCWWRQVRGAAAPVSVSCWFSPFQGHHDAQPHPTPTPPLPIPTSLNSSMIGTFVSASSTRHFGGNVGSWGLSRDSREVRGAPLPLKFLRLLFLGASAGSPVHPRHPSACPASVYLLVDLIGCVAVGVVGALRPLYLLSFTQFFRSPYKTVAGTSRSLRGSCCWASTWWTVRTGCT